ncbi:hypothetical protein MMC07_005147 [Pseudocyphellaria aurata]|nr:hypothetical protein [Pseudocyphellaria aurata]
MSTIQDFLSNDSVGRISKNVYLTIPLILFALSVLLVLARTTLRLRYQKRLFIDDAFLFFAEICLCASVGLLYDFADSVFLNEAFIVNPSAVVFPPDSLNLVFQFNKNQIQFHKMSYAFLSEFPKTIGLYAFVTILDMITDILIMVIPVQLLWNVHIQRRQKLILGASLCLSIVMIFTAIVRISAIRIGKHGVDYVWTAFWQIIESCLAVTVVCLSAFRSVFVRTQAQAKQQRNKQWYVLKKHPQNTRKRKNWMDIETEEIRALPEIPRPTMTGLKTFIRGKPHSEESIMHSQILDESHDQNASHDDRIPTPIRVDSSVSHETDETTNGNPRSRAS